MSTRVDRRVRRTRDLLHRSLIALILEKGYGRITVQDILDRSDLGRSTFYTHYRNKDDLLLVSGMEHLRTIFAEQAATTTTGEPTGLLRPARALLRMADDNRQLYRALVGKRGSDLVAAAARKLLTDVFTEHLRTRLATTDESQLDIMAAFLANGLIGLLTWWLENQAPLSADEMYARFEHIATHGIRPFLVASHPDRPVDAGG